MPSVSKTAANASPQTEKPTHYTYLKEFRTEQCPLFLQHKCTQHRPFTCFHWHFLNQRRRRPIRRRDGTFNYSPDVYCTKYDETTGICPDGDDCPYLHRTTGDTERKYHLRYYKTGTCIHETDARGHCVKNGLHCAFAHGPHDLRPPVYDIREIQAQEALQNGQLGSGEGIPDLQPGVLASQAMIEKTLTEDPRWKDTNFVLANYKTDQCTKPPRLCRQGYACPHYHNSRDRRRNPRKFKYRSTPCPNVKHGDEWGEPSKCDSADSCQYCHSRTEQQFHPEIYKSTKCNDKRQTGYCPRGPFCAFAHVERIPSTEETMTSLLSAIHSSSQSQLGSQQFSECPISEWNSGAHPSTNTQNTVFSVGNPLASSFTSSITSSLASSIGSDSSSPTTLSTMNAKATPFYPGSNTVESVIGSALDLKFSDINVASLEKELEDQEGGLGLTSHRVLGGSAPVNIPGSLARSSSFNSSSSLSTSPLSSLSQSLSQSLLSGTVSQPNQPSNMLAKQEHGLLGTPTSSSQNSLGLNGGASNIWDFVSGSFSPSPSPVFSTLTSATSSADVARLFRDLDEAKRKIKQWEEAWHQVKQACEACQKDALEAKEQAKTAEAERQLAEQKWEETERKLKELKGNFDMLCRTPGTPLLRSYGELEQLPLSKLHSIQSQLRNDLDLIDGVIFQLQSKTCIVCQKHDRCVVLQPCQHYVLCETCAPSKAECPYCRTKILKW
uniref:Unk like zinc finger n=1 Tax=Poecilia reticulata TaxID=8081 RepID=A0A3P9NQ39_POERE